MGLALIIIIRILFAVCMIFIIGYIFGGFSKKPVLATLSKIAAILAIVLFISANILLMRFAFRHGYECHRYQQQENNWQGH